MNCKWVYINSDINPKSLLFLSMEVYRQLTALVRIFILSPISNCTYTVNLTLTILAVKQELFLYCCEISSSTDIKTKAKRSGQFVQKKRASLGSLLLHKSQSSHTPVQVKHPLLSKFYLNFHSKIFFMHKSKKPDKISENPLVI